MAINPGKFTLLEEIQVVEIEFPAQVKVCEMGYNRKGAVKIRLPDEESISALEPMGKVILRGPCPTGKFAQMGISC